MNLIDTNNGTDRLVQTYRHGNRTVRVEVKRDSYERQSFAAATVLSDALAWTPLADAPTTGWYAARTPLADVARGLADRAAIILG
jgi:hypothetical protein